MTSDQADQLAKRIINCWRGGPPLAEWRDLLATLDEGAAGTAFVRLRNELDNAPSIARFRQECNALRTHDTPTRIGEPDCGWCDDTGWTETAVHTDGHHAYSGVKPCSHCSEGSQRAASQTWTGSRPRHFVGEAEAARLLAAERQRHGAGRKDAA